MKTKTLRRRLRGLVSVWLAVLLIIPSVFTIPVLAAENESDSWETLKTYATVSSVNDVTVYDFGGKTIDLTGTISVPGENNATITLKNATFTCSSNGIYSAFNFSAVGITATVTLDAVTIDDTVESGVHGSSAILCATSGGTLAVNIANSTLQNWSSSSDGAGVYVGYACTVNMTNSTISDCSALNFGGGVFNFGTFNMEDSSITDCSADYNGGGVYVSPSSGGGGDTNLSGAVVISGNTVNSSVNNLFLNVVNTGGPLFIGKVYIDANAPLTAGARIGVTKFYKSEPFDVTDNNSVDYSKYFYADNSANHIVNSDTTDNIVQIVSGATTTSWVDFNMQGNGTTDRKTFTYNSVLTDIPSPVVSGYVFGGWYMEPTCETSWDSTVAVTEPIMVYAKWTQAQSNTVTLPSPQIGYVLTAKSGSSSPVANGGDYTFTFRLNPAYSSSKPVVMVNNVPVAIKNGEYTIKNITEAQVVTVSGVKINNNMPFIPPFITFNYYNITATAGEGGSIVSNGIVTVLEGLDQTFTITPNDGFEISDVLVDDVSVLNDIVNNSYTFNNIQKSHTINVTFTQNTSVVNPFTDVHEGDWFYDDVMYVYENNLMNGTSDTTFGPLLDTTRGVIVTMLYRLEGEPDVTDACPFDDVQSGSYYEKSITWAASNGIVNGYGNGKFGSDDPITREQLAAILYRYEQYKGGGFIGAWMFLLDFPDADEVSDWAYEAMCWCTINDIISGVNDGMLAPKGKAERCQAAAILHRFCENIAK